MSNLRADFIQERSQQTQDISQQSFNFLSFTPLNEKAKLAFHHLAQKKASLEEHHSRYIVVTGKERLNTSISHAVRPRSETPEPVSSEEVANVPINLGHFGVGFDRPAILKGGKWIIGRGSSTRGPLRNVDLLLAHPSDMTGTHGLASSHAMLRMHSTSGAWMLYAGKARDSSFVITASKGKAELENISFIIDDRVIPNGQCCCLYKKTSKLDIAGMLYQVQFTIETAEEEERYRTERNAYLSEYNMPQPDTGITAIPYEKDTHIEFATFRHGLGIGGNGAVFEGIDPLTGELRVVKEIMVRNQGSCSHVKREFDALVALEDITAVVYCYGVCTSERKTAIRFDHYPSKAYFVFERGVAFDRYDWNKENAPNWVEKKMLFGQLVEGLAAIDKLGWMHRDVTRQNILLLPSQKRAVFCDFGKAIKATVHNDERLAAWQFLPPELEEGQQKQYNSKIDIWMLALAIISTWFKPALRDPSGADLKPRNASHHAMICEKMKTEKSSGFADILLAMFDRDPRRRPTAFQIAGVLRQRIPPASVEKTSERKRVDGSGEQSTEGSKRSQH